MCKKSIKYITCERCEGNGVVYDEELCETTCPRCKGIGVLECEYVFVLGEKLRVVKLKDD